MKITSLNSDKLRLFCNSSWGQLYDFREYARKYSDKSEGNGNENIYAEARYDLNPQEPSELD